MNLDCSNSNNELLFSLFFCSEGLMWSQSRCIWDAIRRCYWDCMVALCPLWRAACVWDTTLEQLRVTGGWWSPASDSFLLSGQEVLCPGSVWLVEKAVWLLWTQRSIRQSHVRWRPACREEIKMEISTKRRFCPKERSTACLQPRLWPSVPLNWLSRIADGFPEALRSSWAPVWRSGWVWCLWRKSLGRPQPFKRAATAKSVRFLSLASWSTWPQDT